MSNKIRSRGSVVNEMVSRCCDCRRDAGLPVHKDGDWKRSEGTNLWNSWVDEYTAHMKQKWADDKASGHKTKKRLLWRRKDGGETFETNDYPRYLPYKNNDTCHWISPCCYIKSKHKNSIHFINHCSFQQPNPWFKSMSKKYVLIAVDGKAKRVPLARRRKLNRLERWERRNQFVFHVGGSSRSVTKQGTAALEFARSEKLAARLYGPGSGHEDQDTYKATHRRKRKAPAAQGYGDWKSVGLEID